MKTAAHSTYTGPGRVSISLGAPRGSPAGYRIFRDLAPTRDILNQAGDKALYERRFRAEVLGRLDPRATWEKLHSLAAGHEPVLQCFERPPFTCDNWCHRRMVADWFLETLGEVVDETTPETAEQRDQVKRDKLQAQVAPGVQGRLMPPIRPRVEAIRAEIDRWWQPILKRLRLTRAWSWMGMPDRVRDQLHAGELGEWDELQARYKWVDEGQ